MASNKLLEILQQLTQQPGSGVRAPAQQLPAEMLAAIEQSKQLPVADIQSENAIAEKKKAGRDKMQMVLASLQDAFTNQASIRNQQAGGGAIQANAAQGILDRRDARSQRQEQQAFRQQQLQAQIASDQSAATDRSTGLDIRRDAATAAGEAASSAQADRATRLDNQVKQLEFDRGQAGDATTRRRLEQDAELLLSYGRAGGTEELVFPPDADFADRARITGQAIGRLVQADKAEPTTSEKLEGLKNFNENMGFAKDDMRAIVAANPREALSKMELPELKNLRNDILDIGRLNFDTEEGIQKFNEFAGRNIINRLDTLIDDKTPKGGGGGDTQQSAGILQDIAGLFSGGQPFVNQETGPTATANRDAFEEFKRRVFPPVGPNHVTAGSNQ